MEKKVRELLDFFEEKIREQYNDHPKFAKEVISHIENINFDFIEGNNLYNKFYNKLLEIVVEELYGDYLYQTNITTSEFLVEKSPLKTIDANGHSRKLPVEEEEILEFKSAVNGFFDVNFVIKNGAVRDYQENNLLVAFTKNNSDFYLPYLLYYNWSKIKDTIKENVKNGNYKVLQKENGEQTCMTTLDISSIG